MSKDIAEWVAFSDGWFDFYYCSKCGYRTIIRTPEDLPLFCPCCERRMYIKT